MHILFLLLEIGNLTNIKAYTARKAFSPRDKSRKEFIRHIPRNDKRRKLLTNNRLRKKWENKLSVEKLLVNLITLDKSITI